MNDNNSDNKDTRTCEEQAEDYVKDPFEVTFYSYLIMLGAIGWQSLGRIPNPQTGQVEKDLLQAKEIIDLLAILDEKTKGNLSKEEENILKSTLADLRCNYVTEACANNKKEE